MKRSAYCGKINEIFENKQVTVCGWVHSRRDHGGVIFIDLRDREGLVQVVFEPENKALFEQAEKIRSEYVLSVTGTVRLRPEGTVNPNMFSGKVEVVTENLEIINESPVLPFEISDYNETSEELRLKYRYLDMRRPQIAQNFIMRHKVASAVRNFLTADGFIEIETPFLTPSTPEGARDFLVPSRLSHGKFFALPQSPQLFKQILMVAGFDKYFQIARCFRDEDLRSDRQLEFTQIDYEMSFVDESDVMSATERLLAEVFKTALGKDITLPFTKMPYAQAMMDYGTDKPDIRFEMLIKDFTAELANCGFSVFSGAISKGGKVRGICVKGGAKFSRSEIDAYTKFVGEFGAKGLAWMKVTEAGLESNIVKFFSPAEQAIITSKFNAEAGDILFFLADDESVVAQGLGALRLKIAKELNLIDKTKFNFLWVVDFPLFAFDKDENRYVAIHHPFTSPQEQNPQNINAQNAGELTARAYDIVLNGVELGGGSIRIHTPQMQQKVFELLGIDEASAKEKFGFLLDALTYGAPPHGGIALGFDRLCAILAGEESIREVIAFPKTQRAICPMTNAPSEVSEKQLKELGIKTVLKAPVK
ncbi:MAG: aspartate--tRNA ligase [Elusimicrobia bacterium]|nr:aspartate--tRNA ligase [Elusimicrobiota bacterium]